MSAKKRNTSDRSIWHLLTVVPRLLSLCRRVFCKLKIETYFVIKNSILLLIVALMLACLLTATWVSLLAILFFTLLKWQWAWYSAAILVMLLNLLGLLFLGIYMTKIKARLIKF